MHSHARQIPDDRARSLQRTIVLQTLRSDHRDGWARAELETELADTDPLTIDEALTHLRHEGVVELEGETVQASRATSWLDELELIAL